MMRNRKLIISGFLVILILSGFYIYKNGNVTKDTSNNNYLAYIPNVDDGTVSIIDTSSQSVVDEIKVGEYVSHGIAITPDNLKLYTGDLDNGKVFVYNIKEKKIVKTIETSKRIHGIDISPDGRHVLLASGALEVDDKYNYIQYIDTKIDEVTKTIKTDAKSPAHIDFTKDSKYAYVANAMSNDISIIDIKKGEIISSIKVGIMPNEVEPSPDDKFIYVANVQEGSISVVDMAVKKEVDKIKVSPGTHGVAVTSDGKYIWTTNRFGKNIAIIDTKKREVVKTIEINGEPNHVSISPNGQYAYVTDSKSNKLIIFDIKTYKVTNEIEIGNQPHEIDFAKI